jgi:hypothetical protein
LWTFIQTKHKQANAQASKQINMAANRKRTIYMLYDENERATGESEIYGTYDNFRDMKKRVNGLVKEKKKSRTSIHQEIGLLRFELNDVISKAGASIRNGHLFFTVKEFIEYANNELAREKDERGKARLAKRLEKEKRAEESGKPVSSEESVMTTTTEEEEESSAGEEEQVRAEEEETVVTNLSIEPTQQVNGTEVGN